jgi:exodeoxyribonuclease-1
VKTLYWHDYETFGADPARDRPVQFAGIRTDEDLCILGQPLEIYCRPSPDFLPHPEACLITGITPQQALEQGVGEAEFIHRIHAELSQPGTCGVGYNSIRFDDEVTRYTLYRNFYDAYAREWQHGNSRWDLIDVVRMCYALRPERINWPLGDNGAPTFKLERLTQANGIGHQQAHDALADVTATIELARLLKTRQPRLYAYAYGLRRKQEVAKHLNLRNPQALVHISSRYPASRGCAALVVPLVAQPNNANGIVVFDLASDPQGLLDLPVEEIRRRIFSSRADLGDDVERIAVKTVHLNRSPMVVTPNIMDAAGYQRLGIDQAVCARNLQFIESHRQLIAEKMAQIFSESPQWDNRDPDTQLYAGFFSDADRRLMDDVRTSSPQQLADRRWAFVDERLAPLLLRFRARNFPQSLSPEEWQQWEQWRRQRLLDPAGGAPLVWDQYQGLIAQKLAEPMLGEEPRAVLEALLDYGRDIIEPKAYAGG